MKNSSRFALAALLLTPLTTTQAQTVINGVTITKPAPRPTPVQPAAVQPTPVQAAPTGRRSVPAFVNEAIPADWIDVRGRISAGAGRVELPAGSRVTVGLRDLSRSGTTTIDASFPSRSLPVSYQVVSSPRRFNTSGNYAVQVQIVDGSGKVIYANANQYRINPAAKRILADVQVNPAR